MTATINAADLRDRLDRKLADLLATAGELRAIMDEATGTACPHCRVGRVWTDTQWIGCTTCHGTGILPRSHSDLDILVRSDPRTRCASCGGARGSYDTHGQWFDCGPCGGLGYATGIGP